MTDSSTPRRLLSEDVREHNLDLLLSQLSTRAGVSRSYLAQSTGLAPSTITLLIDELQELGLVTTLDDVDSTTLEPGRRKQLLTLASNTYAIAGMQLTGDCVRVSCRSISGQHILDEERPVVFQGRSIEEFAHYIAERIENLVGILATRRFSGLPVVGVVMPAPVFNNHRTILAAIDFGWTSTVDLAALIEHDLSHDVKVLLFNDANCSLWADYTHLCMTSPRSSMPENVLYIKSDVGIGGSAVIHGRIYNGSHGMAMEPGHMQVDPHGIACKCGRVGCLVTLAGPDVLIRKAAMTKEDKELGRDATLALLLRREREGDHEAAMILGGADDLIRIMLIDIITMFTPDRVILGGYLARRVDRLSDGLPPFAFFPTGAGTSPDSAGIIPTHYPTNGAMTGMLISLKTMVLSNAAHIARKERWTPSLI